MKNVVIYAGSKDISDKDIEFKLKKELEIFFSENREKIKTILFGGGDYGVMGLVHDISKKVGLTIIGYSTEEYRKYDERNSVANIEFFTDDFERIDNFCEKGDVFIVLPGGDGTTKELLLTKERLKDSQKIILPKYSPVNSYYKNAQGLGLEDKNNNNLIFTDTLSKIRL